MNATRTSSPPFVNAIAGADDSSTAELGAGPVVTPLGSIAPGYQAQMEQLQESGAVSISGNWNVYAWTILVPLVCGVAILM